MKRVALWALSVLLLGVLGCASKPELTVKQKKTIEYLEALADQKDREADRTDGLAKQQMDRANQLRQEAVGYREKVQMIMKGQDIDEMEREARRQE